MKLAIISSASEVFPELIHDKVDTIIRSLDLETTIMTGGCLGIPGLVTQRAKQLGFKTVAYSPDTHDIAHNARGDNLSTDYFDIVHYIPGFTARSLQMIYDADVILLLNGRIGTLSEFTIALEEGKYVGVITETGGIADHLEYILNIAQKEFPNKVFFSQDVSQVIEWINKKTT